MTRSLQQLTTLGNRGLLWGKVLLSSLLGTLSLPVLHILQGCVAGCLADLGALAALGLDNVERRTLDGFGYSGSLAARTATLCLLLGTLLVQTTVQLGPAMLGGLALHVERRLALRVDEDVAAAIGADVAPPMARVDPEAGVEAKLSPAR